MKNEDICISSVFSDKTWLDTFLLSGSLRIDKEGYSNSARLKVWTFSLHNGIFWPYFVWSTNFQLLQILGLKGLWRTERLTHGTLTREFWLMEFWRRVANDAETLGVISDAQNFDAFIFLMIFDALIFDADEFWRIFFFWGGVIF